MSATEQPSRSDEPVPQQRDGAGVRIALVDSGVDPTHPWLAEARLEHRWVKPTGRGHEIIAGEGADASGHGTACAGIIHRMAPAAVLTSVRALGQDGRCCRDALIAALRYCVRERFAVVNLSLGIDIPRKAPLRPADYRPILGLYELADQAYTASVLLVASGPNAAAFRTYPGRFKSLIGVGRGRFDSWEHLRSARTPDFEIIAPGTDILAPALGGGQRRWSGTSFACPFVTAHIARVLAARPGLPVESVKVALHRLAAAAENAEPARLQGDKESTR